MTAAPATHASPLTRVQAFDTALDALPQGASSLCPGRGRATRLTTLVTKHAESEEAPLLAACLADIGEAELLGFPANLFWDFDYFVAAVVRAARTSGDYVGYLAEVSELVVSLMELYGARSAIRFQYAHDFTYGFDWARWRSRGLCDSDTLPFDLEFLRMSKDRASELLEMIAQGHDRYPPIPADAWRNPFSFSRQPVYEARLYRDLAARGMMPVEAWNADAQPDWTRAYDEFRSTRALALGLPSSAEHHECAP